MNGVLAWQRVLSWVALVLHCTVVLLNYAFAGLAMPIYAVAVLWLIWAALFALGLRWLRRGSARVIAVPVVAAAIWFGTGFAGEQLLGWTA